MGKPPTPPVHEEPISLERENEVLWKLVEHWKKRTIRWMYFSIGTLALALLSFADLLFRHH